MIWAVLAVSCLLLLELASFIIYGCKRDIRELLDIVLKKRRAGDVRTFELRYAEHPFLAYTLNPKFRNSFGETIHNKYGFRCNDDFQDIKNKIVVYCAGDSSTYCNFIEKNEKTWPYKLEKKLRDAYKTEDIKVINGGCGAWTSFQSLIRFSSWIDVLKPDFVIVYHGKTDFIPFINGKSSEKEVFPDYGNVMNSFTFDVIARTLARLSDITYTGRILYGLYVNYKYDDISFHVYNLKRSKHHKEMKKNLERITSTEWDYILSRYNAFAALCRNNGIPVLFVTQAGNSKLYEPYMERLNNKIKSLEDGSRECYVYDFDNDIKNVKDILQDSVHFTESGAEICADSICRYITQKFLSIKNVKTGSRGDKDQYECAKK
jgi:hypothetical protein